VKVGLVYNAKTTRCPFDAEQIQSEFSRAGHEVVLASATADWDCLMSEGIQRVLVAGGDGTVERVLPHLIRYKKPFCIISCGTANNIANSLRCEISLSKIAHGFADAQVLDLDAGVVQNSSHDYYFAEAVGAGLFVQLMSELKLPAARGILEKVTPLERRLCRIRDYLGSIVAAERALACNLTVDGEKYQAAFCWPK
jgi:diacylglycerol kinase family enzyme